jgi:hypothetical protein
MMCREFQAAVFQASPWPIRIFKNNMNNTVDLQIGFQCLEADLKNFIIQIVYAFSLICRNDLTLQLTPAVFPLASNQPMHSFFVKLQQNGLF